MIGENRLHPRVKTHIPAELIVNRNKLDVMLNNISANGVMIETSQAGFETILVNSKELHLHQPVEVNIKFDLPGIKVEQVSVRSHCRAIYVRRQSQNKYFVGFKFLKISQRGQKTVNNFIDNNLGPTHSSFATAC